MLSVASLARTVQPLVTTTADEAAAASGFVQRRSKLTGARFVQTLVWGWLASPTASLTQLTHTGALCGVAISRQGLDQRFSARAAACLKRVLDAALPQALAARPAALPLLRRFAGVYVWDSTTIALPDSLAEHWRGCGGRVAANTQAAVKVQLRWDLTSGALDLLRLQDGRESDLAAAEAADPLPLGALLLCDLGYVSMGRLRALARQGTYILCRLPAQPHLGTPDGQRWAGAAAFLNALGTPLVDGPVLLSVSERVPVRLIARRVPPHVAAQRRAAWEKEARREGRAVSPERWALADWDVLLTTVPAALLSAREAFVLARARWQIELLFRLWKSDGVVDEWRSAKPWRILCEVYAKLLALLIQHWTLLLRAWADPTRSLVKAAAMVRQHAPFLAAARGHLAPLRVALTRLAACLPHAGRLETRHKRPSTAHRLLDCDPFPFA
jgi:hypothetical protein